MKYTIALALTSIAALSACSSGSSLLVAEEPTTFGPANADIALPEGTTIALDADSNEIVISEESGETRFASNSSGFLSGVTGFNGFGTASDDQETVRREIGAGAGSVIVSSGSAFGEFGVVERVGEITIPSDGDVNYSGIYGGLNRNDGNAFANETITGNATLTADFDTGTIGGEITNRSGLFALADITLGTTSIADGAFVGVATTNSGAVSGTYTGLFAGSDAEEVLGLVTLDFDGSTEIGGFTAEQDVP